MKSKYEFNRNTPIETIISALGQARSKDKIYVIARIIQVLHQRGRDQFKLTRKEERKLIRALRQARYYKKPLAEWLPRGYQIARFIMIIQDLLPIKRIRVTTRDITLINKAAQFYIEHGDTFSLRQLRFLNLTANQKSHDLKCGLFFY